MKFVVCQWWATFSEYMQKVGGIIIFEITFFETCVQLINVGVDLTREKVVIYMQVGIFERIVDCIIYMRVYNRQSSTQGFATLSYANSRR